MKKIKKVTGSLQECLQQLSLGTSQEAVNLNRDLSSVLRINLQIPKQMAEELMTVSEADRNWMPQIDHETMPPRLSEIINGENLSEKLTREEFCEMYPGINPPENCKFLEKSLKSVTHGVNGVDGESPSSTWSITTT